MFREVALPKPVPGAMFLHSMPGRYETWDAFLEEAGTVNIDRLVCLVDGEEIRRKSLDYHNAIMGNRLPWTIACFPIPDYGVPEEMEWEDFAVLIRGQVEHVESGGRVLVHCAGGVGRTGTVAVCMLHCLGFGAGEALSAIAGLRAGPETPDQEELVSWHAGLVADPARYRRVIRAGRESR